MDPLLNQNCKSAPLEIRLMSNLLRYVFYELEKY